MKGCFFICCCLTYRMEKILRQKTTRKTIQSLIFPVNRDANPLQKFLGSNLGDDAHNDRHRVRVIYFSNPRDEFEGNWTLACELTVRKISP